MPVLQEIAAPPIGWSAWDEGRMLVNDEFADLLQQHSLNSFGSVLQYSEGELIRSAGPRVTTRFLLELPAGGSRSFYLKRHAPLALSQRLKPWLRLTPAVFGARPEWEAILKFEAAGIPTVTPVAFGEDDGHSWLLTAGLENSQNLLDMTRGANDRETLEHGSVSESEQSQLDPNRLRHWIMTLAEITRRMHDAGPHHQDYYLNHVLLCASPADVDDLDGLDKVVVRCRNDRAVRRSLTVDA